MSGRPTSASLWLVVCTDFGFYGLKEFGLDVFGIQSDLLFCKVDIFSVEFCSLSIYIYGSPSYCALLRVSAQYLPRAIKWRSSRNCAFVRASHCAQPLGWTTFSMRLLRVGISHAKRAQWSYVCPYELPTTRMTHKCCFLRPCASVGFRSVGRQAFSPSLFDWQRR